MIWNRFFLNAVSIIFYRQLLIKTATSATLVVMAKVQATFQTLKVETYKINSPFAIYLVSSVIDFAIVAILFDCQAHWLPKRKGVLLGSTECVLKWFCV
ncbi:hypothetical protein [Endozoicomonas sp. 4G]|uniref:hypothetical protein n=1 Tax=Endozoicomonas sp. 4G TaxID=2872754 RepID=UPI002078D1EE|nr:hypothetical protein [Endozoicomonas sp. 4G]